MFQVVDTPLALPGSCYLCGSGDKRPFIDWGVSIEFHGALYTCFECTGAVASLLGWVPREKHDGVIKENDELISRNLDLVITNRELTQAIDHMAKAGYPVEPIPSHDIQPPGSIADSDGDILPFIQDPDEATRETDELVDAGTGTSDESSDDKGMDFVRSDEPSSFFKLEL